MKYPYIIIDKKAWCCVSIFYSREEWPVLLADISSFYNTNNNQFENFLLYFSDEGGLHVRITFSSDIATVDTTQNVVETHFTDFLNITPSVNSQIDIFGKSLWENFQNNTVVWNSYEIQCWHTEFSHNLSILIFRLFDEDTSIEFVLSIAIYLSIKVFKQISVSLRLMIINELWYEVIKSTSEEFNDFWITNEMVIFEFINYYWEHDYCGIDSMIQYIQWIVSGGKILSKGIESFEFGAIIKNICGHLGLSSFNYAIIIYGLRQHAST